MSTTQGRLRIHIAYMCIILRYAVGTCRRKCVTTVAATASAASAAVDILEMLLIMFTSGIVDHHKTTTTIPAISTTFPYGR